MHRILIAVAMLTLVSLMDIRSREVPDKLWLPFGGLGIALIAYDFLFGSPDFSLFLIIVSITITGVVAFGAYFLGFYGGADAKALLTLSLIMPLLPDPSSFHPFPALMTLSNSLLLTTTLPIFFFSRNLFSLLRGRRIFSGFEGESLFSKIIVMFLGYRVRSTGRFLFKLEKEEGGARRFDFSISRVDDEFASGQDIWVTPGLPLLIFITLGFLLLITVGDLVFILVRILFTIL